MKISCVTTTFNEGALLLDCVRSIQDQSHGDYEHIIVADGATQETLNALDSVHDPKVTVIRQPNTGLSSARNKALEHVTGEFVCFLDADDSRPNWSFQAIADIIGRDDPDLVFCKGAVCGVRGETLPFYDSHRFDYLRDLVGDAPIDTSADDTRGAVCQAQLLEQQSANKVVRTSMMRDFGLRFPDTHFFEDAFFHTSALARAERISFVYSPCFTYFRRHDRQQITAAQGDVRFDIIPVTKMTLEAFAKTNGFSDPRYRACVIASCFKLVEWCEMTITHSLREQFRTLVRGLLVLMDPRYLDFPRSGVEFAPEISAARSYIDTYLDNDALDRARPNQRALE